MDDDKLKRLLAAVYAYYRKPLEPLVLKVWQEALKGYDFEIVKTALGAHAVNPDNGQFLPTAADIVKLIDGGSEDVALQAWAKVDAAIRRVGPYRSVVFDDPLIHTCITSLGGWVKVCSFTEDDWKFQRTPFVTMYRGARMRALDYPPLLIGIAQAENGEKHRERPILIGDEMRCLLVLERGRQRPALEARPLREILAVTMDQQQEAA